jgi:hypothetical protein
MSHIKIIKLNNGDDLIASVGSGTPFKEEYTLSEPMRFFVDQRNNNSLVMQHFLPVQLVSENKIILKERDILAVLEADEEFIEYYKHTIEKIKRLMKAKADIAEMSDEEINHIINEFEMENNETGILH